MGSTTLALTYHDPPGRMFAQLRTYLPVVQDIFGAVVVETTAASRGPALDLLLQSGADLWIDDAPSGLRTLGRVRRAVMRRALDYDASTIMYCDTDRVLHWAMCYPDELREVANDLDRYDVTILGRTPRAFASHPRTQRDTEAIINQVYALISGKPWDVTAASRGFRRHAAERLVLGSTDDTVGVDATWPLWAQQQGDLILGYRETEGLEFETADRFEAEVAASGGIDRWTAALDADPDMWAERVELAQMEVSAMQSFAGMLR